MKILKVRTDELFSKVLLGDIKYIFLWEETREKDVAKILSKI
jgi:hypothetical protein